MLGFYVSGRLCERAVRIPRELLQESPERQSEAVAHLWSVELYCTTNITLIDVSQLATADVIGQAQFALDINRLVLPLYEEVFDIEYPLPKLDTLVVCGALIHAIFFVL